MNYNTLLLIMTIIFSIITIYTCINIIIKKRYKLLGETIVAYIAYLFFLFIQYKYAFKINIYIIMLVLISIIGNNFIGDYMDLYNSTKHYDRFLHALGSFSFALFFYSILDKLVLHITSPKYYVSIFVATIGISLGCIYEIYEFILDSTLNYNNQHGLKDTNFDLLSDVIGSIIAAITALWIF